MTTGTKNPRIQPLNPLRLYVTNTGQFMQVHVPSILPFNPVDRGPRLYLPGCYYSADLLSGRRPGQPVLQLAPGDLRPDAPGGCIRASKNHSSALLALGSAEADCRDIANVLCNAFNLERGVWHTLPARVNTNTGRIVVLGPERRLI